MMQTHHCEIDFYIDGELGPDDASAVETELTFSHAARTRFDELWRQKDMLIRALEALDTPSPANRQTARLQANLARAIAPRISTSESSPLASLPPDLH
ncbi:anti-sigma factor family protein [Histidinibacterium aquaticum]|uniref:Anti-sigma factor n=1 Tax=Histidinibacterium aquaticum TaxID=2613962 RepID=A0A5J5GE67_9RHOB|nr:hypothetical protein [Histidinibacterium aquaticum]KAA9005764.1 hypothetical protein F3S47_17880 [Histidinibacterium aquaticum]